MAFSEFLDGRRNAAKELVKELGNSFSYVSVLGTDVRATSNRPTRATARESAVSR